MTIIHQEQNYLEGEYLRSNYLETNVNGALGSQFTVIIDKQVSLAAQYKADIVDSLKSLGIQQEFIIASEKGNAIQYSATIDKATALATQFLSTVADTLSSLGVQFDVYAAGINSLGEQHLVTISNNQSVLSNQFSSTIAKQHSLANQYSVTVEKITSLAMQYNSNISKENANSLQYKALLNDKTNALGMQYNVSIAKQIALPTQYVVGKLFHQWTNYLVEDYLVGNYLDKGMFVILPIQYSTTINSSKFLSTQYTTVIESSKSVPIQFKVNIQDKLNAYGVQYQVLTGSVLATQFRVALYNTTNLRILCDFPSRGVSASNWTASSTASGDFSIDNVNTDIVEQVWRSNTGAISGITLICDTGINQGVYLDTLAFLNHNLTTSADVEIFGSNDPLFSSVGTSILFQITTRNFIYIAPDLPLNGYRYWKIIITDNTNPDNYLQIGTIVFGESIVFQGECFSNPISYKKTHYSDQVMTEGFTNVNNDRGIKTKIGLNFEKINFSGGNYNSLVNLFETARTNLKCLWVPTPQYPTRYAAFGKLTELPQETHTDNGENADYVDFSLEIDEAK